jgi:hypothetical protein
MNPTPYIYIYTVQPYANTHAHEPPSPATMPSLSHLFLIELSYLEEIAQSMLPPHTTFPDHAHLLDLYLPPLHNCALVFMSHLYFGGILLVYSSFLCWISLDMCSWILENHQHHYYVLIFFLSIVLDLGWNFVYNFMSTLRITIKVCKLGILANCLPRMVGLVGKS